MVDFSSEIYLSDSPTKSSIAFRTLMNVIFVNTLFRLFFFEFDFVGIDGIEQIGFFTSERNQWNEFERKKTNRRTE